MICSNCGEWIEDNVNHCPYCEKEIRFEKEICITCGYPLQTWEKAVNCPGCGKTYHNDCWQEHGCSVAGCSGTGQENEPFSPELAPNHIDHNSSQEPDQTNIGEEQPVDIPLNKKRWYKPVLAVVIIMAAITLGMMTYFTTPSDIEKYAMNKKENKLYDILVNSNAYHFYPDNERVQNIALSSLRKLNTDSFREIGWQIIAQKAKNQLTYTDVLTYSDVTDIEHFASLYIQEPEAITADGMQRYKPFQAIIDELKKVSPQSNVLKEINSIYRIKNIEKSKQDIASLLSKASSIDEFEKYQSALMNYGIPFDNKLIDEYKALLEEISIQASALRGLRGEKDSIKDPKKIDNEIKDLQYTIAAKGNQHNILSGLIVAQISYNEYEIIVTDGGYFNDGEVGRHAILETDGTRFETQGYFNNLAIGTLLDNREVQTKTGFWQEWYVYHEKSWQELQRETKDKQEWTTEINRLQSEKAQSTNKLGSLEPRIATLDKKISALESKKEQVKNSWDTSYQELKDSTIKDLDRIASEYANKKIYQ